MGCSRIKPWDQLFADINLAEEKRPADCLYADPYDLFIVYDSLDNGTTGGLRVVGIWRKRPLYSAFGLGADILEFTIRILLEVVNLFFIKSDLKN